MRVLHRVAFVAVFLLGLARAGYADEFTITGGNITVPGPNRTPQFTLTGDGFLFSGGGSDPVSSSCSPCIPGQTINVHVALTNAFSFGGQPGTFDGVDYPAIFLNGILRASSEFFPVSSLLDSGTITVPFTASGPLWGFRTSSDANFGRSPIFERADFVGSGTVTATYSHIDVGGTPLFDFRSAVFTFEPSAAATPEPATLLLFGIGGGVTAIARRRRRGTTPARTPTA